MPANTTPIFSLTANKGTSTGLRLTLGNLFRDLSTTTNAGLLFTAGTNGSRIDTIDFTHSAANSTQASIACVGRIYLCTSNLGAGAILIKEIALPAVTPTASAIGQQQTITFTTPLFIPSGMFVWASISVAQTSGAYDISCYGADY